MILGNGLVEPNIYTMGSISENIKLACYTFGDKERIVNNSELKAKNEKIKSLESEVEMLRYVIERMEKDNKSLRARLQKITYIANLSNEMIEIK